MSSAIEIDGKILHPVKEAVSFVSYTKDYITRLAREEKIIASNVGNQWFVDIESLKSYAEMSALEKDVRKRILSEERKKEQEVREAVEAKKSLHQKKQLGLRKRAVSVAVLVLGLGLFSGYTTYELSLVSASQKNETQVANVKSINSDVEAASPKLLPAPKPESKVSDASVKEIKSLGDISNGILLLPNGTTETPEEIFSDLVIVKKMSDGTERVVKVDADGNLVGEEIPFVRVPATSQQNI